jgi:hypothetical protein
MGGSGVAGDGCRGWSRTGNLRYRAAPVFGGLGDAGPDWKRPRSTVVYRSRTIDGDEMGSERQFFALWLVSGVRCFILARS